MSFENLGLCPEILRALKARNYQTPTPIQAQAIPAVLSGRDIIGCAQTGTGKTAGFTLPILERLRGEKMSSPRVLVLVPTRELAAQVLDSIRTYGRYLPLKAEAVYGGVSIRPQITALRRGVDILVATPGRLLDHLRQKHTHLRSLEVLVIDEADRLLDMGFIPDVRAILKNVPSERQTLFFSATMPEEIRKLANEILKNPQLIQITPQGTPAVGVRQRYYTVASDRKRDLLLHLMEKENMEQVLVFTRTKHRANRLADHLETRGKRVAAIHGNKSQGARTKALAEFRSGSVQILVATNIAARGLDIRGISHVVNFEIPEAPEDYVHRIGRTARAEETGDAISFVSPNERGSLRDIERLIGSRIPQVAAAGFEAGGEALAAPRGNHSNTPRKNSFGTRPGNGGGRKSFGWGGRHR